jgi:8-oxo-dGTP pyrophosphatase MutT (NUDIX family)
MLQKQYGVLPYVRHASKIKLILITSRTSHQWIVPKGARVRCKSKRASAQQEAFEEAGLKGPLDEGGTLHVTIIRNGKKIALTLYPMRVKKVLRLWPEGHQRERIMVSIHKAEMLIACPKLKRCLRQWQKTV